jgi:hypothetical protein
MASPRELERIHNRWQSVDRMVYVIACIVSLGLVYLIRVILTQAVADGIAMDKRWQEIMKS